MSVVEALLGVAVVIAMVIVDYAHANYQCALRLAQDHGASPHIAARWSVLQWGAAAVGFAAAVGVSLWYLPLEAVGLYIGTLLGARKRQRS